MLLEDTKKLLKNVFYDEQTSFKLQIKQQNDFLSKMGLIIIKAAIASEEILIQREQISTSSTLDSISQLVFHTLKTELNEQSEDMEILAYGKNEFKHFMYYALKRI